MSKLDNLLKSTATINQQLQLEIKKTDIKILMLEIFGEALSEAKTLADVGDVFRRKVEEL